MFYLTLSGHDDKISIIWFEIKGFWTLIWLKIVVKFYHEKTSSNFCSLLVKYNIS